MSEYEKNPIRRALDEEVYTVNDCLRKVKAYEEENAILREKIAKAEFEMKALREITKDFLDRGTYTPITPEEFKIYINRIVKIYNKEEVDKDTTMLQGVATNYL